MNWITLDNEGQLAEIDEKSFKKPQLIFKHSTRCSISSVIKNRLYKGELPDNIDFYYLDLIANRPVSNEIANRYGIEHESPQVLLIKDGKCIFNDSHNGIYMDDIVENAK
ncbi:bacillithiol system redox-active protein YtxJ [Niabella ginsengisoli]|uniref:Bacillithiol system redox-active protein YtxJ n=1 Tax=Niabella ginsengisoli TaxID=522298 RepID=A0ABS9SJ16_9BACT|nr:bacillithiol system redox-active protein YtxJ [Niabella ginsengisoli]MCH5598362.1 bacillithiol system redox-active protein YtxJ [Niabella ginsengisoli]